MKVLQLGLENWANSYQLSENLKWYFNDFPPMEKEKIRDKDNKIKLKRKVISYDVVLITGKADLTQKNWKRLKELVPSYHVLYLPEIKSQLDQAGQLFLKECAAQEITQDPQTLIDKLEVRYFSGQSGMRIFPTTLKLNDRKISSFEYLGTGELKLNLDTHGQWMDIGTYKTGIFIDPNKLINLWLSIKLNNFKARLRIFVQNPGTDGDPKDQRIIDLTDFQKDEYFSQIQPSKQYRTATIGIEVNGSGELIIGILHSRWGRDGVGNFLTGGKRLVNPTNREDIAYYFNLGDLKPPLNVYFSGAREAEGFEAYFLFKSFKAPMLLFTDMRISIGQFYDDQDGYIGQQVLKTIKDTLAKLGFKSSELTVSGISMGTYAAIKYGAQLAPYAIDVAKPLISLGYIASRMALDRPDGFDTIFDIDQQIKGSLTKENLEQLDQDFMDEFDKNDLSKTRLFVGYMKDDDYDDLAINKFRKSPAVKEALQFSAKGFAGRHNDDPAVNYWFIDRLTAIMKEFGPRD
ncbi:accessory Sec system protein Asp2 [uncultured Lactobacillus sp.]|uniref:accessory Sec system protein Asp2 n=1 Tax=uncultured Lactobacillus sp. TaxID=153152 RepID=UPI00262AA87E|nr:accessory Sec system protein Asp2 [uncultured Lactobacillus sp.]